MDENIDRSQSSTDLKYCGAENESLKCRIEEYKSIDGINKNTILELQQKLVDFNILRNQLNDAIVELGFIKSINEDLIKKLLLANNNELSLQIERNQSGNFKHKLEEMENDKSNLQVKLANNNDQLNKQHINSITSNEQISKLALLECLLADAKQERDEWKAIAENNSQVN